MLDYDEIEKSILHTKGFSIEEPTENDKNVEKLSELIGELEDGEKIVILRLRPGWCKGYLEELDASPGEPISISYLIEHWGGQLLRLRARNKHGRFGKGVDIPLYSWPPRRYGKELRPDEFLLNDKPEQKMVQPVTVQTPPPNINEKLFDMVLKVMSRNQSNELSAIRDLLDRQMRSPDQSGLGLDNLTKVAETYKTLQGLFGNSEPVVHESDSLIPQITDIAKLLINQQTQQQQLALAQQTQQRQRKLTVVPPRQTVPPQQPQTVPPQQPQTVPPQQPNPQPQADLLSKQRDAITTISSLSGDDAAETVIGAIGMMPPAERETAMERFMQIFDEYGYEDEEELDEIDKNTENIERCNEPAPIPTPPTKSNVQ